MLSRGNTAPMFFRILSKFPQSFSFCFAYGSGVKQQLGYESVRSKRNMIDLIYVVDNAHRWHTANLDQNFEHYSGMRLLGGDVIAKYQETFGARVYFNTLVQIPDEDVIIKYGVVSTKDLLEDLTDWRCLYLAGRLHKPVEIIRNASSSKIQNAIEQNLRSAVHAALLLLPEKFTEFELYRAISNLSYSGDFRMIFGENKDKVNNIVRPQLENFRNLYSASFEDFHHCLELPITGSDNQICTQDLSEASVLAHLNGLPKWPIRLIVERQTSGRYRQDTEDILIGVSRSTNYQSIVASSLRCLTQIQPILIVVSDDQPDHQQQQQQTAENNHAEECFGPALPPAVLKSSTDTTQDEIIGPALPPHLQNRKSTQRDESGEPAPRSIGPALPPGFVASPVSEHEHISSESELSPFSEPEDEEEEDHDSEGFIGPLPGTSSSSRVNVELEQRALELKIRQMEEATACANGGSSSTVPKSREDWMLELPDIRKISDMGLGARQFRTREKPEIGDRSVWTDTPADRERKKKTSGTERSAKHSDAATERERERERSLIAKRDKEQEKMVKQHKKKHKRDKTLLEIHQTKLKEDKKASGDSSEPTRRPFDRNVDLHANRFDDAQKKAIMKKAQLLNSRFSSGSSKYL
uniref:Phosphatidate cytidylyltransferase, mitochondrial n=1 Tax=Anopheles stephensi TaxID=30069 RepID=A0A182Y5D4_ANOST